MISQEVKVFSGVKSASFDNCAHLDIEIRTCTILLGSRIFSISVCEFSTMSICNRSFYALVNLPVSNGAGKAQAGLGPGRPHKVGEVGGGAHLTQGLGVSRRLSPWSWGASPSSPTPMWMGM